MSQGQSNPQGGDPSESYRGIAVPEMCYYCFDVLVNHLKGQESKHQPSFPDDPYPIFVSWKSRRQSLRGCIGTFKAVRLHSGLRDYAIESATKDSRFSPIKEHELTVLTVAVSILVNFEPAKNYNDWEIGVHGIKIEFQADGNRYSGTFLPEVAVEQNWSKKNTVDALIQKTGYSSSVISEELRSSISVTRYQSEVVTINYHDYERWRRFFNE